MKNTTTSVSRRRPSMAESSAVNGELLSGSSSENSADDYEEPYKEDSAHGGASDTSCASIKRDARFRDDVVDGSCEPGKYNFQLLPEHCVQGRQGQKLFKCDICNGSYRHAFSLKRHYLRNHINYDYLSRSDIANCNINVGAHTRKSGSGSCGKLEGSTYRCNICNNLFNEVAELKNHIQNHPDISSSKRFVCKQCNMTFSHKQNLVRHLSVHSGEKPYACRHCGKGFPTATNQRRHERIHQGLKPYVCIHCHSHFSQSGDLKKHIRKLHGDFFHPCAFCMKYFARRSELEEHVISHGKSLEINHKVLKRKYANSAACRGGSNSNSSSIVVVENRRPTQTVRSSSTPLARSTLSRINLSDLPRRYRCNLCNKRFFTSVKLQRHRNIEHPPRRSEPSTTTLTMPRRLTRRSSPENVQTYDGGRFSDPSPYFASVSQNIAHNLQFYLDGKLPPGKQDGACKDGSSALPITDLAWSKYNFPPGFAAVESQGVASDSFVEPFSICWYSNGVADSLNSSGDSPVASESETNSCTDADVLDLSVSNEDRFRTRHDGSEAAFSKSTTVFLCQACGECFLSSVDIEEHKINNHPNVHCTHFEVENLKDVPLDLFRYHSSPEGALLCCPVPPVVGDMPSSHKPKCTKCSETFSTSSDLHEHILVCGGHVERRNGGQEMQKSIQRFSRRVVKRGMKRRLEMTDDVAGLVRRRCRKAKKEPGWDWLPVEQPEVKSAVAELSHLVTSVSTAVLTSSKSGVPPEVLLMCDGCNQKFKYVSALERHQKFCLNEALRHRGQHLRDTRHQAHSCPYCRRSFTYPASLKKHMTGFCAHKERMKLKGKATSSTRSPAGDHQSPKSLRRRAGSSIVANSKTADEVSAFEVEEALVFSDENNVEEDSPVTAHVEAREDTASDDPKVIATVVTSAAAIKEEASEEDLVKSTTAVPLPLCSTAPSDVVSVVEEPPAIKREARSVGTSPCRIVFETINEETCAAKVQDKEEPALKIVVVTQQNDGVRNLSSGPSSSSSALSSPKDVVKAETNSCGSSNNSNGTGQSSVRQEQHHTCPNCKRTFTYLANFKKHLNVLCPLRTVKKDGDQQTNSCDHLKSESTTDVSGGGSVGDAKTDTSDGQNAEQERVSSHKCNICHAMFSEYVEMLKHRILHKLKTTTTPPTAAAAAAGGGSMSNLGVGFRTRFGKTPAVDDGQVPSTSKDGTGEEESTARIRRDSSSSDEPLVRRPGFRLVARGEKAKKTGGWKARVSLDCDSSDEDSEDVDGDLAEQPSTSSAVVVNSR